jgi:hypothetical protein
MEAELQAETMHHLASKSSEPFKQTDKGKTRNTIELEEEFVQKITQQGVGSSIKVQSNLKRWSYGLIPLMALLQRNTKENFQC